MSAVPGVPVEAAVLVSVPSEDAMFELLSGLNVSGIHPELACTANGHAYLATLTDPDASHVHIVVTNETGIAHCCMCEHDGLVPDKFAPCTWEPPYPVNAIVTEWPDEARCREDDYDVWWVAARDAALPSLREQIAAEVLEPIRASLDEYRRTFGTGDGRFIGDLLWSDIDRHLCAPVQGGAES